jgi:hypothetical protein
MSLRTAFIFILILIAFFFAMMFLTARGCAAQTITLTAPNGGESWAPGSSQRITWTWTGSFPYVRIDYSTDGGSTWTQIVSKTGNDGVRTWIIPEVSSSSCRVRVRDQADGIPTDMSDRDFSIGAQSPGVVPVRVAWDSYTDPDATALVLFHGADSTAADTTLSSTISPSDTSFTTSLPYDPGSGHYFWMQARDAAGNHSVNSNAAYLYMPADMPPPRRVRAYIND